MDITKIADVKELKALAYDEIARKQLADQNLMLINRRIAELEAEKEKQSGKTRSS